MGKNNYVIHYRNLQQCLGLGLKLKKVHKILQFKQNDWMKPYIDFNTQKRTISNNESDRKFLKLMNNAVYGKTMENMRKRLKVRIVIKEDFIKYTSKPTRVDWNIYGKKLATIHEKKVCLTLHKRIYVGFSVLEIRKWKMHNFDFHFMIKKFNTKLLFTDTDTLCYEIYGENPHQKIYKYRWLFDLSNYPKSSNYCSNDNKKVVGKVKDE